ncbi:MAG: hypothetical protein QOH90_112 [Actinomycetota bacterium]|jgi:hypothetical protein|nr:hypothetical protein [Actinomycetota bacterium]
MRLRILALLAFFLCVGVACTGGNGPGGSDIVHSVRGVVVKVDAKRLDKVKGFTVASGAKTYDFRVDPGITYSFPLAHLHTHLTSSEPVLVGYEDRDGVLYALTIEDG